MGALDDRLRRQRADQEAEIREAEAAAIASGKEPFHLATLEALLGAAPGSYAHHEPSLRRSYYVLQVRLMTLADFAGHVREMQDRGFWDE